MNPEFRRQLWLGFSPTRMVVLPLLLLSCFFAAYVTSPAEAARSIALVGAALFAVLAWGMATLAAASSVMDEIADRTWDQQRMSAMQPWAMTWGKLAGSSAYGWFGGAICLLVAVPAGLQAYPSGQVLQVAAVSVVFGLGVQALMIAVNLQAVKSGAVPWRRGGVWPLFTVLLVSASSLLGLSRHVDVNWWGRAFETSYFLLASAALFGVCALVSAWRSMAEVLAVRQLPWGWPALALVLTLYVSGFVSVPSYSAQLAALGVVGLVICSALTYFALLTEAQPRPLWQRVIERLRARQWRQALLQLPRWPTTLLLAAAFALAASLLSSPPADLPLTAVQAFTANPIAFLLLMVRDCALALFFAFSVKNRRAVAAFLLLMFVLYGLLPWLVGVTGSQVLLGLAQPVTAQGYAAVVVAAAHVLIAMGMLRWRWRTTAP